MPKQPDPMTMDLYGADRYEVAPKWGPGMISGPYSTNAAYFTAAADQPVTAMGCSVSFDELAGHDRPWSSVTLVPWHAGPLTKTRLGQATPWHVSVTRSTVALYVRQSTRGRLEQIDQMTFPDIAPNGAVTPVAVVQNKQVVACCIGEKVHVSRSPKYASAERGYWPCWETYVYGIDQDPRPWFGQPWYIQSAGSLTSSAWTREIRSLPQGARSAATTAQAAAMG